MSSEKHTSSSVEEAIYNGNLNNLPKVRSKTVRIFTSSTFTDTRAERDALIGRVYPVLKEVCRERFGLDFQVVDMRWGIRTEATDDHSSAEQCFKELRNCQKLSVGPNFVVFIGQKYGFRPLPASIEGKQFRLLKDKLTEMKLKPETLDTWYKEDLNCVPSQFILQPVSSKLPNFTNYDDPELQTQDARAWWEIFETLQKLLRVGAVALFSEGRLTKEEMHNYFASITEQEVVNGILKVENPEVCTLAYIRKIENVNLENSAKLSNFFDVSWITGQPDPEAADFLKDLAENRLMKQLPHSNVTRYTVDWKEPEVISQATHEDYLNHFTAHFYGKILDLIEKAAEVSKSHDVYNPWVLEILDHLKTCKDALQNSFFPDQHEILEKCQQYILGSDRMPLVLLGSGGSGKTVLLSKCFQSAPKWLSKTQAKPILILRFIGISPKSCELHDLLQSICHQLTHVLSVDEIVPDDLPNLISQFHRLLGLSTKDRPIFIFLDSLDSLVGHGDYWSNTLSWLPSQLPQFSKVIATRKVENLNPVKEFPVESASSLPFDCKDESASYIFIKSPSHQDVLMIMKQLLGAVNRDVTTDQWQIVSEAIRKCALPLYLKLVFDEIIRWRSYTPLSELKLQSSVHDSIQQLFDRIEQKHGKRFVSHALGYVTVSTRGLTESELEDVLSLDDTVLNDVYEWHLPPARRIPPLLWTRLRSELPGYFSERTVDDSTVIDWNHREFRQAVTERYLVNDIQFTMDLHSNLADFYLGKWGGGAPKPYVLSDLQIERMNLSSSASNGRFEEDRKVPLQPLMYFDREGNVARFNLRKLKELPHHLIRSGRFAELFAQVLFSYKWIHAKVRATTVQAVLLDYESALMEEGVTPKVELKIVAETIRFAGNRLKLHPEMIATQLIGRLSKFDTKSYANISHLLADCHNEGKYYNALLPRNQCFPSPGEIRKILVSKTSQTAATLAGNCITVWNLKTMQQLRMITNDCLWLPVDVTMSADGRFIASCSASTLYTWETSSGKLVLESLYTKRIERIIFSADSNLILLISTEETGAKRMFLDAIKTRSGVSRKKLHVNIMRNSKGKLILAASSIYLYWLRMENASIYLDSMSLNLGSLNGIKSTLVEKSEVGHVHKISTVADSDQKIVLIERRGSRIIDIDTGNTILTLPGWNGICSADAKHGLISLKDTGYGVFHIDEPGKIYSRFHTTVGQADSYILAFTVAGESIIEYGRGSLVLRLHRESDGKLIGTFISESPITCVNTDLLCQLLVGTCDGSLVALKISDIYSKNNTASITGFQPMIPRAASKMLRLANRAHVSSEKCDKNRLENQAADIFDGTSEVRSDFYFTSGTS